MKRKEFIYNGEPIPKIDEQKYAAFLVNIQKAILLSLEKRNLITKTQQERCVLELEKK